LRSACGRAEEGPGRVVKKGTASLVGRNDESWEEEEHEDAKFEKGKKMATKRSTWGFPRQRRQGLKFNGEIQTQREEREIYSTKT